jgi:hypothetical protein
MYTKAVVITAWPVLGAALACTLFVSTVGAKDQEFTVAYRVNTQGLDPGQPVGAHEFYSRLSMLRRSSARCICKRIRCRKPRRPGSRCLCR